MPRRLDEWTTASWWRPATRVAAVLAPLVVCALLYLVRDSITAATAVLVLVLLVVTAAAGGDRVAGVLAALASVVGFDFFLTRPYLTLTIARSDDIEVAVLLVLISLAVTEVALWGYRQQAQAARRSGYLDGVLGAARVVAEGETSRAAVVDVVGRQVVDVLGADDVRYVDGPLRDVRVAVLDHDGTLTRAGRPVDVDRVGLPTDEYTALLVRSRHRVVGHFLVTATTRVSYPNREQRRVAVLLADQVAATLTGEAA